ncbi:hypothetical protein BDV98DRAFT_309350 [Pterulicium gracile]|uniref:Uncharacterized protein n=1 Tax=Pterulicium gracile TaxID=1884261 RepID=A0A5C3Q836_9AGAR|nr:hypothetical protein BDV98DRAFT_309350 [Pterula gracilis]
MESQQQKGRSRARKRDWIGNIFRPSRGPSPVPLSDVPPSVHPVTTDGSSGDTLAIPVRPVDALVHTADLCLGDSRTSTGVPIKPSDSTAVSPLPGDPQNNPFVCQAPSDTVAESLWPDRGLAKADSSKLEDSLKGIVLLMRRINPALDGTPAKIPFTAILSIADVFEVLSNLRSDHRCRWIGAHESRRSKHRSSSPGRR